MKEYSFKVRGVIESKREDFEVEGFVKNLSGWIAAAGFSMQGNVSYSKATNSVEVDFELHGGKLVTELFRKDFNKWLEINQSKFTGIIENPISKKTKRLTLSLPTLIISLILNIIGVWFVVQGGPWQALIGVILVWHSGYFSSIVWKTKS